MKISIIGAALGTTNMGVTALAISLLEGVLGIFPEAEVTIFDYKFGFRRKESHIIDGVSFTFYRCGMNSSKKIWKHESIYNLQLCSLFGLKFNPILNEIRNTDLALSITGGDSFTDLYGKKVFTMGKYRKELFLKHNIPLILMPQTYGPFSTRRTRSIAKRLIARSRMAWARDEDSYIFLKDLLGNSFDKKIHRLGIDVAFALSARAPKEDILKPFSDFSNSPSEPVIGFNVNGLIYNDTQSKTKFNHIADYKRIVNKLVKLLLDQGTKIVLIPHVMSAVGEVESDLAACLDILANNTQAANHLYVMSNSLDPCEVKWVISQCDWFCGTRMHSTIAALSTNTPTATIAYSLKARGVFMLCGQGQHIADLRLNNEEEIEQIILDSFKKRDSIRGDLRNNMPEIIKRAKNQFADILTL